MSTESIRQKLAKIGDLPGLSEWLKRTVLLYRCRDIDQGEFLNRVHRLYEKVETLFQQSLPESMEKETYLVAQEYYDAASEALDSYLSGLDALLDWVESNQNSMLEAARFYFAKGDKSSKEVVPLAFEAQESFRETDEALMRSLGVKPEGIE